MKKIMFFVAAMLLTTIMFSCKKESSNEPTPEPQEEDVYPEIGERNCILLEEFTGQACGNCPRAIASIEATIESMAKGSRVAWVAHHSGYYDDLFTQQGDLDIASAFKVNYAPAGILERTKMDIKDGDGNVYVHLADYFADSALLNKMFEVPAEASISLKVTMAADSTLTVKVLGKSNQADSYLTIMLCQNGIQAAQSGSSGTYTHNEVVRAYLTPSAGDALSLDADKKYKDIVTYKIPAAIADYKNKKAYATDIQNMFIVAVVHGKLASKGAVYNTDKFYLKDIK